MSIQRDEGEINTVRDKASEQIGEGGSAYPAMTYEDGILAALDWVLGHQDDAPLD